jgi:hypothetical protein
MSTQVDTAIRRNYVRIPGSNNPKKRPMNKQSYKKAALEHGDFQSPVQAIQHHVELAMAHAFLFMDGTEPDRIMHILNMALVEILSPKALVPEVIAVPSLVIDLFSNVPEPSSIPEENVIAEEHISTVKLS